MIKARYALFSLLVLAIILCVVPKEAEAAPSPPETGVCGPSAVWKWEDGVLTISGSGAITEAPWREEYCSGIEEIVVGDEITEIGNRSFGDIDPWDFGNIPVKVTLGSRVEKIGDYAFACSTIKELTIPDSVTELGKGVFDECGRLKKVVLSTGIKRLRKNTFRSCNRLEEVNLEHVQTIEAKAFNDCPRLKELSFGEGLRSIVEKSFHKCPAIEEITFAGGRPKVHKNAFCKKYLLKKIANHSRSHIVLPEDEKLLIWRQNGKKVTKVSPGQTATSIGKKYKLTYTGADPKLFGRLPATYRFREDVKLPMSVRAKGKIQYFWNYDGWRWTDEIYGFCVDLKLRPCWMKYRFVKKSATKTVMIVNLDAPQLGGGGLSIRYSKNKNMKQSSYAWCSLKDEAVLKKLEKGATYYIQFRTKDGDFSTPWSGKLVYRNG